MNSKKLVNEFLNQNKIAVVGVSRKRNKFGNVIYRELKRKGIRFIRSIQIQMLLKEILVILIYFHFQKKLMLLL
jgi:predicted CoA-binding protein